MKSVLISIRPEWCEKILTGEKTVEVRKTWPNLEAPFKCYVYCTNSSDGRIHTMPGNSHQWMNGRIIGYFVCDKVYRVDKDSIGFNFTDGTPGFVIYKNEPSELNTCMSDESLSNYLGIHVGWGWHISNLHIYPEPVKMKDFWGIKPCKKSHDCCACEKWDSEKMNCDEPLSITRPPQSWCYMGECL